MPVIIEVVLTDMLQYNTFEIVLGYCVVAGYCKNRIKHGNSSSNNIFPTFVILLYAVIMRLTGLDTGVAALVLMSWIMTTNRWPELCEGVAVLHTKTFSHARDIEQEMTPEHYDQDRTFACTYLFRRLFGMDLLFRIHAIAQKITDAASI